MEADSSPLFRGPRYYIADRDGWRILVTPWVMQANEGGLQELTAAMMTAPHYRALVEDVRAVYLQAGARSLVLLYEVDANRPSAVTMVGSLWLEGPLAPMAS